MNAPKQYLFDIVGKSFIFYLFILLSISTLGFILGLSISNTWAFLSLIIVYLALIYLYRDIFFSTKVIVALLFLIIFSILLSLQIWDFSWDGRWYHFTAIDAISNGWNPVYSPKLSTFMGYSTNIWAESYPKANWIFVANHLKLFHNIEAAKYINYALALSTSLILYSFLRKDISNFIIRSLFVLAIIVNPVSIGQINTLYLDGNLYYLIITFSIALANYYRVANKANLFFLLAITVILLNMKFTAVVFLVVGFILFFLLKFLHHHKIAFKEFKLWAMVFVVGIGIIGYSPYITNFHFYGHPLYPAMGHGKKNIIPSEMNHEFIKLNRFKKFIYSITSKATNDRRPFPEISNPLIIASDMKNYESNCHDIRVNGFGPIYSLSLILTIFGLIYVLYRRYRINHYFFIAIMFVFMSFAIPPTWWARLIPMMWAVPIFFSLYFYSKTDKILKFLSLLILFALLINAYLFDIPRLKHDYRRTTNEYLFISQKTSKPIFISFKSGIAKAGRKTIIHKLDIYGIKYKVLTASECKKIGYFYDAIVCKKK